MSYLIDVLHGKDDERIKQFGHDNISTFGIGAEITKPEWQSIFRQLVAQNLLAVDSEGHGGLRLTPYGQAFLKEKKSISLRKYTGKAKNRRKEAALAALQDSDADLSLLAALKATRMTLAKAQNVPPYVIFHDKTLYEMAAVRPANFDDLARLHGMGEKKMERYGRVFLEAIALHAGA